MFPLLRSSRSFFTRLNPPPPWESALVIYNLEPFHFLCNYETADNPARFIIRSCRCSFSPLSLPPALQSCARKNAIESRAFLPFLREEDYHLIETAKSVAVRWDTGDREGGFVFILPLELEKTRIYVNDSIRSGN